MSSSSLFDFLSKICTVVCSYCDHSGFMRHHGNIYVYDNNNNDDEIYIYILFQLVPITVDGYPFKRIFKTDRAWLSVIK